MKPKLVRTLTHVFLTSLALIAFDPNPSLATDQVKSKEQPGVLARVGGRVITAEAFRQEMLRRSQMGSGAFRTPKEREALLEEMVRNAALASAAAGSGYDKDPEILAALDRILADKYVRDHVAKGLKAPTEDEVKQFYEEHAADYGAGERRRGAFILIRLSPAASAETKQSQELRARQAVTEARGAETNAFGTAASRYSDDTPTRYVGGDMGWVQKAQTGYRWDNAVTAALFGITQPGEVVGPVATPEGFYVVRLVEKTDGKPRPLALVRPNIEQRIVHERRTRLQQEAYDQARRDTRVNVDQDLLQSIEAPPLVVPASEEPPPPLPGTTPASKKPKPSPEGVR